MVTIKTYEGSALIFVSSIQPQVNQSQSLYKSSALRQVMASLSSATKALSPGETFWPISPEQLDKTF